MPVNILLIVAVLVFVFVAMGLFIQAAGNGKAKASDTPYRKCPHLMSAAEQRFFAALREADDDTHWLFTKVRLADLVTTVRGLDKSARQTAFNKIKAKHADFVLCDPQTLVPVLVVELDDASHNAKSRRQRDDFVDRVYQAAELPILHVKAKASYDIAELSRAIERLLSVARQPVIDQHAQSQGLERPDSGVGWLRSGRGAKPPTRIAGIDEKATK